jgi:ABC-2 type transport system permease protein
MNLIWTVFRYEAIRQASRTAYLLLTFGLPIVALFGFGMYSIVTSADSEDTSTDQDDIQEIFENYDPIGYVDPDGVLQEPTIPPFTEKVTRYPDEASARQALEDGDITVYFLLHGDYLETGNVDAIAAALDLNIPQQTDLFEAFALNSLIADEASARLFLRLQNPLTLTQNTIERGTDTVQVIDEGDDQQQFWVAYVFVLALIGSTLISSGYLMSSVIEERETRMIEIIISSVRPGPLLAGKILAQGALGLLQVGLWIATFLLIITQLSGDLVDPSTLTIDATTLVITLIYFILGYMLFGAAYAGIGAVSGSLREGSQLLTVVILPAMAPLYFLALLTEEPNGTLATVMSLVPITAPVTMVVRATLTDIPLPELALSIALLSATVVVFVWLGGRLFRVGVLLTGSFPGVRELLRYLREKPEVS